MNALANNLPETEAAIVDRLQGYSGQAAVDVFKARRLFGLSLHDAYTLALQDIIEAQLAALVHFNKAA